MSGRVVFRSQRKEGRKKQGRHRVFVARSPTLNHPNPAWMRVKLNGAASTPWVDWRAEHENCSHSAPKVFASDESRRKKEKKTKKARLSLLSSLPYLWCPARGPCTAAPGSGSTRGRPPRARAAWPCTVGRTPWCCFVCFFGFSVRLDFD